MLVESLVWSKSSFFGHMLSTAQHFTAGQDTQGPGDGVSQIKNVDERFTFMFYKRNINENFRGVNFGSLGL